MKRKSRLSNEKIIRLSNEKIIRLSNEKIIKKVRIKKTEE